MPKTPATAGAVSVEAVQTVENNTVVFIETPTGFVTRQVTLGGSDGKNVQVLKGLSPGERYAASNTFVLKSELGKGSAEHEH
jgi:cobalt-zinc-cadmium efflux system membrane fusion protein